MQETEKTFLAELLKTAPNVCRSHEIESSSSVPFILAWKRARYVGTKKKGDVVQRPPQRVLQWNLEERLSNVW